MGTATTIGPDHNPRPGRVPARWGRALRQGEFGNRNVIGGCVGASSTRPEEHRHRLPGAASPVADPRTEWMEPETAIEGGCVSKWAVTRVASRSMTSARSRSMSWLGPSRPANPQASDRTCALAALIAASAASTSAARVSISRDTAGSEATSPNRAGSARIGRCRPAVTTDRDRHRQIQQHLPGVVDRLRPTPRLPRRRLGSTQTDRVGSVGQQHRAGLEHRPMAGCVDLELRIQTGTLQHHKRCS